MVLSDAVGPRKAPALARIEKDLESARALPPDSSLTTVKESMERLATSATEIVHDLPPGPDSDALRWARAFEAQCRLPLTRWRCGCPRFSSQHLTPDPALKNVPYLRASRPCVNWPALMISCRRSQGADRAFGDGRRATRT